MRRRRVAVLLAAASALGVTVAPAAPVAPAAEAAPEAPAARADAVRDAEYWLDDYGIRDAWSVTRGAGVTIAVIDTGVGSPRELEGAVVGGTDLSGKGSADGRTPVGSEGEHGTLVASLAAGRGTGADAGIIGSAPEASVLAISIGFSGETPTPRSPRACGGRSTTAPTSSTCRSPATPSTGPRAGMTPSPTPWTTTS
ncbi:hypothetical protein GCM10025869_21280 [Homoserinibacter gongjuensis]|uniref:Peptidase S8/S53 domain-containing protein n=1 Tax=Homoserinibacter gongjuensis TaxID=1162968 RepID=A0ABQ6JWG8_9MICO|nr:hypothetical protein GCM10025869_21280 [Homoserinibacter gongjuensis]